MHSRILLSAAVLLAGVTLAHAQDDPAATARARNAVERSLPFLEKGGVAWMKAKGCASCHNVTFLLWSHNAARARGIPVDEKKLADWTGWTVTFSQAHRVWFKVTSDSLNPLRHDGVPAEALAKLKGLIDKPFRTEEELLAALGQVLSPEERDRYQAAVVKRASRPHEGGMNDGGGLDTLSQLLLGRDRDARGGKLVDDLAAIQDLMLRWQQPDGSWKAAGQLPRQNRTEAEANEVSTTWAVLALASLDKPDAATAKGIKQALDFLSRAKPGKSNESLIGALLAARRFGQAGRARDLLTELLSRQNADGGWAWRQGGGSDAFATGQALYALAQSGLSADHPAVERARDYLIGSQTEDGSWSVPGRAISAAADDARLGKVAPIYRYWGTAWATIGLAETLPEPMAEPRERERHQGVPPAVR